MKIITAIGVIIAAWSTYLTSESVKVLNNQLKQEEKHQKWENYNILNERYSSLSIKIAEAINNGRSFHNLSTMEKWVIRSYFDLTSEEYWLYKNKMIPKEMWDKRIINGIEVNLKNKVIREGYLFWINKGAIKHPVEFNKKIQEIIKNEQIKEG